jgi:hypothetical protein
MSKAKLVDVGKAGVKSIKFTDVDPTRVVEEMARVYREYHEVREKEHTKRVAIQAKEQVALAEIAAKRELFLEYLTRSFDERAANFSALFARLDVALEKGDTQALAVLTNAISDLAKSSPFKDLVTIEATRKALRDADHEWDV